MVNTRLTIGEYDAWLVVENEEVEHYGIDVNEGKKVVTCWVASTAGKHFGVWVKKRHERFSCTARIFIDGVKSSGALLSDMQPGLVSIEITGAETYRPFLFGTVDYTDDDSLLISQTNEDLGNVTVQVVHISNFRDMSSVPIKNRVDSMNRKVHEKAKKALTHHVTLGEMKSIANTKRPFQNCTFDSHETVATFIFRYRSLDMLKANGIAPCDPPSQSANTNTPPISGKRKHVLKEEDEDDGTLAEVNSEDERDMEKEAELEAQLEIQRAQLEVIRKARLERNAAKPPNKKIKLESKPVFLPGEVIDLTI